MLAAILHDRTNPVGETPRGRDRVCKQAEFQVRVGIHQPGNQNEVSEIDSPRSAAGSHFADVTSVDVDCHVLERRRPIHVPANVISLRSH